MDSTLERLETRIKELIASLETLRAENRSFRSLAGGADHPLNAGEVIERIKLLKQEKEKLEEKLARANRRLAGILERFDKLDS